MSSSNDDCAFLETGVTLATMRISVNSHLFKHRLKFLVLKIVLSLNSFIIFVGISLESDLFLMSRFFIFLITSVLTIFLKNILFLSKWLGIVTIRLYISCLRGRSREKIFINSNIFYNTDKNSLNVLANSPSP